MPCALPAPRHDSEDEILADLDRFMALSTDEQYAEVLADQSANDSKFASANDDQAQGQQAVESDSPLNRAVCVLSPLQTLTKASTPTPSTARILQAANENRKPWTKANEIQKFHGSVEAAEHEKGFAFSLNLSPARIKKLMADAANGNDPTRRLSLYLNREFQKYLGYVPPYSFGFEFSPDGRLHAHGSGASQDALASSKKLLHKALSAAGGKIKGCSGSTQAHSTEITYGTGWFRYTVKTLSRTRKLLGTDKVVFINRELKQMTRAAWDASLSPKKIAAPAPVAAPAVPVVTRSTQRVTRAIRRIPALTAPASTGTHQRAPMRILTTMAVPARSTSPPA